MRTAIVSYIPLFYPRWPLHELTTKRQQRIVLDGLTRIFKEVVDNIGEAQACMWTWDPQDPSLIPNPIWVMNRGNDIHEHLRWWSQNTPEKYFTYNMYYDPELNWYAAALLPNFKLSLARVQFNIEEVAPGSTQEGLEASHMLFAPLRFYSGDAATFRRMKESGIQIPAPGDKINLGIIDSALVDFDNAKEGGTPYNPDDIRWIENMPVAQSDEFLRGFYDPNAKPGSPIPSKAWLLGDDAKIAKIL